MLHHNRDSDRADHFHRIHGHIDIHHLPVVDHRVVHPLHPVVDHRVVHPLHKVDLHRRLRFHCNRDNYLNVRLLQELALDILCLDLIEDDHPHYPLV